MTLVSRALSLAPLALAVVAAPAVAAPTFYAGTGHYYEYINTQLTWTQARAAALSSSYSGMSGYLATVTSSGENSFLSTLGSSAWIGLTDEAVEGSFIWADGPEAGQAPIFTSWNPGEPNNAGNEDYTDFQNGNWNDLPSSSTRGYFVEYSASSAVPEPATWGLMILGFGTTGAALRRHRKASVRFV